MTAPARRIDQAAFGVIDGSITVMALLTALRPQVCNPGRKKLAFVLAAVGLIAADAALILAQVVAIVLLGWGLGAASGGAWVAWRQARSSEPASQ